jgi:hypothetical protein
MQNRQCLPGSLRGLRLATGLKAHVQSNRAIRNTAQRQRQSTPPTDTYRHQITLSSTLSHPTAWTICCMLITLSRSPMTASLFGFLSGFGIRISSFLVPVHTYAHLCTLMTHLCTLMTHLHTCKHPPRGRMPDAKTAPPRQKFPYAHVSRSHDLEFKSSHNFPLFHAFPAFSHQKVFLV